MSAFTCSRCGPTSAVLESEVDPTGTSLGDDGLGRAAGWGRWVCSRCGGDAAAVEVRAAPAAAISQPPQKEERP